jgi:formiminotetrahydrofolate cyclodeaminase
VPLEVARKATDAFERLGSLRSISSSSMASDVKVGRLMAAAAVHGALANVEINLESITDQKFSAALRTESAALAARVANPVS